MNTINLNTTSFERELNSKALKHELKQVQLYWSNLKLDYTLRFANLELASKIVREHGMPDQIFYLNCTSTEAKQVHDFWFSELVNALRGEYNLKQAQLRYINLNFSSNEHI